MYKFVYIKPANYQVLKIKFIFAYISHKYDNFKIKFSQLNLLLEHLNVRKD